MPRGRGRGKAKANSREFSRNPPQDGGDVPARKPKPPPRPTHFLSIPLGSHPALRAKLSSFNNALLASSPPVEGLDKTIIIEPRRVHLTLGVMNLVSKRKERRNGVESNPPQESSEELSLTPEEPPRKSVSDAVAFLQSLGPSIKDLVPKGGLSIPLNTLSTLKRQRRKQDGKLLANVLYAAPSQTYEGYENITKLCEFVNTRFREEGFITETRQLTLHLTMINTSHRKEPKNASNKPDNPPVAEDADDNTAPMATSSNQPEESNETVEAPLDSTEQSSPPSQKSKKKFQRKKFSKPIAFGYSDIVECEAGMKSLKTSAEQRSSTLSEDIPLTIPIDLGTYIAPSIQLCIMGSRGEDGEYVSLGEVKLDGDHEDISVPK